MEARKRSNKRGITAAFTKRLATPFLKWAGGKGQLLREFEHYYPTEITRYFEPFVGGGAVFFALAARHKNMTATISDSNPELINCYTVVRDHVDELIASLQRHRNDKQYYYRVRAKDVSRLNSVARASRLIYLNRTCFNGLYRVNRSGQFNVPFGSYTNPRILDETNLRLVSRVLQRAIIQRAPFESILPLTQTGDFVYLDPPYQPISATSNFTSYTAHAFTQEDQKRLACFVNELHKRGCLVMLSNSDNDFIADLYSKFKIHRVTATRAINCKGTGRGRISELVITNY